MKEWEFAYAAGFFDGEGSVCVKRTEKPVSSGRGCYYNAYIDISNTDRESLEWFADRWGGKVGTFAHRNVRSKELHSWRIYGPMAVAFLRSVLPYLGVKERRAELAIELESYKRQTGPRTSVTDEEFERMEQIFTEIRKLNARGPIEDRGPA